MFVSQNHCILIYPNKLKKNFMRNEILFIAISGPYLRPMNLCIRSPKTSVEVENALHN